MREPHHVLMLALPMAQTLDVIGPMEVFAQANWRAFQQDRPPPSPAEERRNPGCA